MKDWLEIQFWKVAKHLLKKGYGYCDERDGEKFMSDGRCGACDSSDVYDWVDAHIRLLSDE